MKNLIIDVKQVESDVTEPVSLESVKEHLRITGTAFDNELNSLITQCRRSVENYCNISIVNKNLTLIADIFEEFELPYGPVKGILSVELRSGTEGSGRPNYDIMTSGWATDGEGFDNFVSAINNRHRIVYNVGYTDVPHDLVLGIMNEIYYRYEHRGNEHGSNGMSADAINLINPYRRLWWI